MKILLMTQVIDQKHPILGFFHRWIEEFACCCNHVTVIGQSVGQHALPENVTVHSLGKEQDAPLWRQMVTFWRLCIAERNNYNVVLVHMTPVWIVLGWPVWVLLGKKSFLWYEVRRGGWILRVACLLSRKIFSATDKGLPWLSRKQHIIGHGIDTALFKPSGERDPQLIVTTGRITPIKNMGTIVQTFSSLSSAYRLRIIGDAFIGSDQAEKNRLLHMIQLLQLHDRVEIGFCTQTETAAILGRACLFLHASQGGLDKAILEAMACGCLVISSSDAAQECLPPDCRSSIASFTTQTHALLALPLSRQQAIRDDLRSRVLSAHTLPALIATMIREMER